MAVWKCKFCGAPLEVPESSAVASCEYCGVKQTVPKLDDERRNLLLDRAGQFLRSNEYDRAAALYEQAINEGGDDPELFWSLVLCRYGIEYVEDAATHRRIPTVNRTQFSAVSADPDYREAVSRADAPQREIYEREAAEIDAIQRGILEISQKEEPFDVFICYKESDANGRRTPDSVLAQELYYGLKNEGFKVFFSRISLEDKLGTAYEPYIFSALHSAKVMVVVGTKPEYFKAVWVKNEWSRYLALIKQGEKKTLIPAYRDMDPYDLPDEFAALQAQDMGKLGFMQDLVRGIKKIIGRAAPKVERTQTPATPSVVGSNINSASKNNMLERGFLSLEDGEWEKADDIFEQVLNLDLHEARAYIGKVLASRKFTTTDALADCTDLIDDDKNFEKAIRFADEEYKVELKAIAEKIRQNVLGKKYGIAAAIPLDSLSGCYQAEPLFRELGDYMDSAERADFCAKEIERRHSVLEKETLNALYNTKFLRVYSILSMFFLFLFGILMSSQLTNALFIWVLITVTLLIVGIVVCVTLNEKKWISVVSIIPAFFSGLVLLFDAAFDDLLSTVVSSIVAFAFYLLIVLTQIKLELKHFVVPSGTTCIKRMKYANKTFSAVTIPTTVTSIEDDAFFGCANLTKIYYNGTKNAWNEIRKSGRWISGMNSFLVQCSDGQFKYSK